MLCSGIVCWRCGIRVQAEPLLTCSLWTVRVLGVYDRLEQGVCIAWALFGNEFSVVVEGLDMVLFIWQE